MAQLCLYHAVCVPVGMPRGSGQIVAQYKPSLGPPFSASVSNKRRGRFVFRYHLTRANDFVFSRPRLSFFLPSTWSEPWLHNNFGRPYIHRDRGNKVWLGMVRQTRERARGGHSHELVWAESEMRQCRMFCCWSIQRAAWGAVILMDGSLLRIASPLPLSPAACSSQQTCAILGGRRPHGREAYFAGV